jgi:hypothetical protein
MLPATYPRGGSGLLPAWLSAGFKSFTFTNMVLDLAELRPGQKALLGTAGPLFSRLFANWSAFNRTVQSAQGNDRFDFPGYGLSDKPIANYTYSLFEQADVALQVWKERGVTGGHVLSHDMGDSVHTELVARHILESLDSAHFYVGITDDLRARLTKHNAGDAYFEIRTLADKNLHRV